MRPAHALTPHAVSSIHPVESVLLSITSRPARLRWVVTHDLTGLWSGLMTIKKLFVVGHHERYYDRSGGEMGAGDKGLEKVEQLREVTNWRVAQLLRFFKS